VDSDGQACQRAAIWYAGAFAALGSTLLGGASIASVDWSRAAHPWLAFGLISGAVIAAFLVVTLAALVISPGCTVTSLREQEDVVQRRLQRQNGGAAVAWPELASSDGRVLRALYNDDVDFAHSPNDLWAAAKGGDHDAHEELASMVDAANCWLADRRFRKLRVTTPMAAVIILVGGLAWKSLTVPIVSDHPTAAHPLPVVVTLAPGVSGTQLIGPGCTLRVLNGLALTGGLKTFVTVAFAPQSDCPGAVITLSPAEATVLPR
jgi:hypothetical protein